MIIEEIVEAEAKERDRIAKFLRDVLDASTHGASQLIERAIRAVEENKMSDPKAVARPKE